MPRKPRKPCTLITSAPCVACAIPHRLAGLPAEQRGDRLDVADVERAAEAAADVGRLHDAHSALGDLEHERELLAQAKNALG